MSYNESLNNNSNYPRMSQSDWDNAPWNQPVIPEKEFSVAVSQTLSKIVEITTDDYYLEYDKEDGYTYANTENTDWKRAYENSDFKIQDLLLELKSYVQNDLDTYGSDTRKTAYLKQLLKACDGWIEDDYEVCKN